MENVWEKIRKYAGESFYTKTGIPFTYHIRGDYIVLENTNRSIPKSQVEEALKIDSSKVSDYSRFQGYAYLFGLVHDSRIV